MEEQPGPQQHHHHHHNHHYHHHHHHSSSTHGYYYYTASLQQHGAEGSQKYQPKPMKHDQKHALQHQETHQKRTVYGELNGTTGDRKTLGTDKPANQTASRIPNGSQQAPSEINTTSKHLAKTISFVKANNKPKTLLHKNSMDKKNEKSYECKPKDVRCADKGESGPVQNGLLTNSPGFITNGYVSKGAENDGSGSESGYATANKRKAKFINAKSADNSSFLIGKMSGSETKLDSENMKPDLFADQKGVTRADNGKTTWKSEPSTTGIGRGRANPGDIQRKNSDAKPVVGKKFDDRPKGKASPVSSTKEDSWTLFKPPPVFPVDNSSAKIVPKISYASKVKENLNKAAQNNTTSPSSLSFSSQAGETISSNCVSQVPMSAMKSVSTINFANGPLLVGADGGFMATAASTVSHTLPGGAEPLPTESSSASTNPSEQKKSGLFTYPSNMQHALPDALQGDQSGQSNQHSLGDIFQNQWGLSFINEPSAGPEAGTDKPDTGQMGWERPTSPPPVSQGAETVASGNERPVFPKAYELEKRTSPQVPEGATLKAVYGPGGDGGALSLETLHIGELQKPEAASQGLLVLQAKVCENEEIPQTSLKNTLQTSAKDKRYHGDLDCKDSWGSFDLRAAIIYHTKEMESILNLQKQDPSRIITYNEAMDRPNL
ncbi:hypothetical protein GDO78_008854 [Eleutherodactylus coqui]|uniref:Nuclear fragile X mental retardation-interacting protein 2 n=1 Tax=Eleutherodactylus coqui TaxID=57060 RepID=A0A8J6KAN2_ELECQ|nr:hypothetical protein GDO78_008854 [Eleutherodactylus coqui]